MPTIAAAGAASGAHRRRRGGSGARLPVAPTTGRDGLRIAEVQRARVMSSALAVLSEEGYEQMSVARVTGRARVSRRTFYDVFADREDCFLAVFEDAVARATQRVVPAYEAQRRRGWREQVRGGLEALLVFFDQEPGVASLLVVDALRAGPRTLRYRAEVLARVGAVLDRDAISRSQNAKGLPGLTGEGVVGAVFSVIHTRLLANSPRPLAELLNPLMGMIVLPYQGPAAARKELQRPPLTPAPAPARASARQGTRERSSASRAPSASAGSSGDLFAGLPMRLTYRTLRVLAAIGEHPGASNREVSDLAEVQDQGQISKLLSRLERLGLVCNEGQGGHAKGEPNSWSLTETGERVFRDVHPTTTAAVGGGRRS